ncbi:MBL fold metallo-hydrolase [Mycobacterium spongiae]|uniref:MBL fold metallo-hydrolase n=1 Tax=Mycobacterium spongiae TaxID=886343 RepID=A0A975JYM9_9MYCO|nr:MBL fold metallo-hydrolase [Mycobacterium spongiae]QUR68136.1 MBL fold metallo-hydrolase [Mycobacterium spongiae]
MDRLAHRDPITAVSVIATGAGEGHYEHVYGTRKPSYWWVFFGRRWLRLPINVYVIAHQDGVVLFDAGMDPAVETDADYWPDPITAFFMRHIFRWHIGPDDSLSVQLERAGYSAAMVVKAVISHLHSDHVGGIAEIPQAELFTAAEGFAYMRGPHHPERHMVLRERTEIPGAKWRMIPFEPNDDPALEPFTEKFDLMGDGSLVVVPTPGHLAGSVSMLVRRNSAPPLLLVGDLTYAEELLYRDQFPAIGDKKLLADSFAKVRALKKHLPDLVILPAHDLLAEQKLRAAAGHLRQGN